MHPASIKTRAKSILVLATNQKSLCNYCCVFFLSTPFNYTSHAVVVELIHAVFFGLLVAPRRRAPAEMHTYRVVVATAFFFF